MTGPRPAWAKATSELGDVGLARLNGITPAWAWGGATGAGVRVAIVDSGIEAGHPALDGRVDEASSMEFRVRADGTVEEVSAPHRDAFGHGTACASIVHRLAPDASITSVKVLDSATGGKAAAFLAGLSWAVEQGYDVVNLSLGTRKADWAIAFHEACDEAYFRGTLVVTAANNVAVTSYPSLFASVASVACNLARDPFRFHANPDPPTEFLARGIDVEVAWRDGTYSVVTGNSFAAPHIAGIAALIRSKHPDLRPFQIKSVLWATAANVVSPSPPEFAGRLSRTMTGFLRSRV